MRRAIASIAVTAVLALIPQSATLHTHPAGDHEHPEHQHGLAAHGHQVDQHRGEDAVEPAGEAVMSECGPASHVETHSFLCSTPPSAFTPFAPNVVARALKPSTGSIASAAAPDERAHAPPGRRRSSPRSPPR